MRRRRKDRRKLLLVPAALLLAAVLFLLLYHPIKQTDLPQVAADRLAIEGNSLVWADDAQLHGTDIGGEEIFSIPLGFSPERVFAKKDVRVAAGDTELLITDPKGETQHRVTLSPAAESVAVVSDRILALSGKTLYGYTHEGEPVLEMMTDDPLILAREIDDTTYVLTGRADGTITRGTLYTLEDDRLTIRFPVQNDLIIDFAADGERLAVATTTDVYLADGQTVRLPVDAYKGMAFTDELVILDENTLKTYDATGQLMDETDTGRSFDRMSGRNPSILWNDEAFSILDDGQLSEPMAARVKKADTQDGIITVYAIVSDHLGRVAQGSARAWK